MSEFDDRARAAGARARQEAKQLAAARPFRGPEESGRRGGRSGLVAVAAAMFVAVAGGWYLIVGDGHETIVSDHPDPTTHAPPSSAVTTVTPTTVTTTTVTTVTPTSTTPTEVSDVVLRPYVDPAVCAAVAASEQTAEIDEFHPFARGSTLPISLQAIGDPVRGVAGPFALVLRYGADREFGTHIGDPIEIDDRQVGVRTYANGNGEAIWELTDGGTGYVRTRGLDDEHIIGIVAALDETEPGDTPTGDTATGDGVVGFEVGRDRPLPDGLELLAEGTNSGLSMRSASLECRDPADGAMYRINVFVGDPVLEYVRVIDGPVPLAVGRRDGATIVIRGPTAPDGSAPTVDDVGTADEATWAELLERPSRWDARPPLPPTLGQMAATDCATDPVPPHLLPDGEWAQDPEITDTQARWGDDRSGHVVQMLPAEPLGESVPADVIERSRQDGTLISVSTFGDPDVVVEAAVIPIGDPPVSQIAVYIATPDGCIRHYLIGPGLDLDEARHYVEVWLIVWGRGEG